MPQRTMRRTYGHQLIVSALLFVLGLSGSTAVRPQSRSEWQTIEVADLFTFRLPADWTRGPSNSTSEMRGEWTEGTSKLIYIWGQTESGSYAERRQSWMHDHEEAITRLGGLKANIRCFSTVRDGKRKYVAELNAGNWEKGEVQLYMHIEGKNPATVELAKQIFKSVRLAIPSPERPTP